MAILMSAVILMLNITACAMDFKRDTGMKENERSDEKWRPYIVGPL